MRMVFKLTLRTGSLAVRKPCAAAAKFWLWTEEHVRTCSGSIEFALYAPKLTIGPDIGRIARSPCQRAGWLERRGPTLHTTHLLSAIALSSHGKVRIAKLLKPFEEKLQEGVDCTCWRQSKRAIDGGLLHFSS
jgi:hypothetical protein